MLIFNKKMIDSRSRVWLPGKRVPDNFSTELGLAEMIMSGDIIETDENEKREKTPEERAAWGAKMKAAREAKRAKE